MTQTINRFDHVGSYLRPDYLLEAREKNEAGEITDTELREVENKAILNLIKKQEEVGLKTITDGEFRRASWHCDFFWGFDGVDKITDEPNGSKFEGKVYGITARLSGKISGDNHPFIEDWKFTRDHASDDVDVKLTIPAPAQFVQEALREINIEATKKYYASLEDLVEDTIASYSTFVNEAYEAGLKTLQFDDCTWGRIISGKDHTGKQYTDEELNGHKELFLKLNNGVIENAPAGLTVNTHVCRGNFASTWFASGAYNSVANPLFTDENVNTYYLEYDSDRAGGFEPLAEVSGIKNVVLGLATSKDGKLEDKEALKARIKEAAGFVPLNRLGISTQCGFSSNSIGNKLSEEDQGKKISVLKEVAEEVWG